MFDVFMLIVVSMDEDQVGNRDYSMPRQARKSIAELPPRRAAAAAMPRGGGVTLHRQPAQKPAKGYSMQPSSLC